MDTRSGAGSLNRRARRRARHLGGPFAENTFFLEAALIESEHARDDNDNKWNTTLSVNVVGEYSTVPSSSLNRTSPDFSLAGSMALADLGDFGDTQTVTFFLRARRL